MGIWPLLALNAAAADKVRFYANKNIDKFGKAFMCCKINGIYCVQ